MTEYELARWISNALMRHDDVINTSVVPGHEYVEVELRNGDRFTVRVGYDGRDTRSVS